MSQLRDRYIEKIAATRWKELIHLLGKDDQKRLLTSGVNDWKARIEGINTGTENLRKIWHQDEKVVFEDIDELYEYKKQLWESLKEYSPTYPKATLNGSVDAIMAQGRDMPLNVALTATPNGAAISHKGFIVKPNISELSFTSNPLNVDKDWAKYKAGEISPEQKYLDAVMWRHEIDEGRVNIKQLRNKHYRYNKKHNIAYDFPEELHPAMTSNMPGVVGNHMSPEVLHRESVLTALAPPKAKRSFLRARTDSGEIANMIPSYGRKGVLDKEQIKVDNKKVVEDFLKNVTKDIKQKRKGEYLSSVIPL